MALLLFLSIQSFNLLGVGSTNEEEVSKLHIHLNTLFSQEKFSIVDTQIVLSDVKAPIIILNFWASWCTPCLAEFPSLVSLRNKFSEEELKIIGINADTEDQERNMNRIIESYKLNFPNVIDKDGSIVERYLVRNLPVSIIFHRGKVIEISRGQKDFEAKEFIRKIQNLIGT